VRALCSGLCKIITYARKVNCELNYLNQASHLHFKCQTQNYLYSRPTIFANEWNQEYRIVNCSLQTETLSIEETVELWWNILMIIMKNSCETRVHYFNVNGKDCGARINLNLQIKKWTVYDKFQANIFGKFIYLLFSAQTLSTSCIYFLYQLRHNLIALEKLFKITRVYLQIDI